MVVPVSIISPSTMIRRCARAYARQRRVCPLTEVPDLALSKVSVSRRERQAHNGYAHQGKGQKHGGLATHPIAHAADDDRTDRTSDKTNAEGGERRQQSERRIACGKERAAD